MLQTVDIEKLLGTSINICTENGQLKAKYLYAESSSMSSAAGDIIVGSIHGKSSIKQTKLHFLKEMTAKLVLYSSLYFTSEYDRNRCLT